MAVLATWGMSPEGGSLDVSSEFQRSKSLVVAMVLCFPCQRTVGVLLQRSLAPPSPGLVPWRGFAVQLLWRFLGVVAPGCYTHSQVSISRTVSFPSISPKIEPRLVWGEVNFSTAGLPTWPAMGSLCLHGCLGSAECLSWFLLSAHCSCGVTDLPQHHCVFS